MSTDAPLLDGVSARLLETARTTTHLLEAGDPDGELVLFVHGNASAGRFFEETLLALPSGFRGVAVDLRGFGRSAPDPIDATRGVRDFSDDVLAVLDALDVESAHLVGWSVGGGVILRAAIDAPERVRSLTLVASMSPYGFAGTKDLDGTPCFADHAGSGGGTANPGFVKALAENDRGHDPMGPRGVMNAFYFKPPFSAGDREEVYLSEVLSTHVGDDHYPGDISASPNWPTVAPGTRGMNNAISSKYCNLAAFAGVESGPPVLWIRGADDQIVSDTSMFDVGHLGALGAIPGWPGAGTYPAQPMVSQLRHVLDQYAAGGGEVEEVVIPDCGHSPHVEKPQAFREALVGLLNATRADDNA